MDLAPIPRRTELVAIRGMSRICQQNDTGSRAESQRLQKLQFHMRSLYQSAKTGNNDSGSALQAFWPADAQKNIDEQLQHDCARAVEEHVRGNPGAIG